MSIAVHIRQGHAYWLFTGSHIDDSHSVKRAITRAFGDRYQAQRVDRNRVQASILVHVAHRYRKVSLNELRVLECTVSQAHVGMYAGSKVDTALVDEDQISQAVAVQVGRDDLSDGVGADECVVS